MAAIAAPGVRAQGPQPQRKLYVVTVPADEASVPAASTVAGAAREVVRALPMADWADADRLFLGYDESSLQALQDARDKLEGGRQAYLNLELDKAIELLEGASNALELAQPVLEDGSLVYETLLLLGASYTFQGMERKAREVFQRMHVQFPGREPDPNVYPPDVVQRYRRAAPRGRAARPATVRIETDPPGAEIFFDYVPMGRTPIDLADVPPGRHVVRLLRPGAQVVVQDVLLSPRQAETVSTILADQAEAEGLADAVTSLEQEDFGGFTAPAPLTEVIGILGVERMGVLRVEAAEGAEEAQVQFLVFGGNGRRLLRADGTVPLERPGLHEALQKMLSEGFHRTITVRQARDEERVLAAAPPPPPSSPIYEKWWFWAAVGGVAAAGTVAAVVALQPSPPQSAFVVVDFQQ